VTGTGLILHRMQVHHPHPGHQPGGTGDVRMQRQIDDRQWGAPPGDGGGQHRFVQHPGGLTAARNHQVDLRHRIDQRIGRDHGGVVPLGEPVRATAGRVHQQSAAPARAQLGGHHPGVRPGADDEGAARPGRIDRRDVQRDGGHRPPGRAEPGLGGHLLGHPGGGLEELVDRRRRGARRLRLAECAGDLPGDLGLPDHHRIQPGGDREQVRHRGRADPDLQHRADLVRSHACHLRELGGDRVDRVVESRGVQVDLQAIAGRHHHRADDRHVGSRGQLAHGSAEQCRMDGQPVQLRQLEVVMARAENHEHDAECYRCDPGSRYEGDPHLRRRDGSDLPLCDGAVTRSRSREPDAGGRRPAPACPGDTMVRT
jgi:hypothetical protein